MPPQTDTGQHISQAGDFISQNAPHHEEVIEGLSEVQQGGGVFLEVTGEQVMQHFKPQQHLDKQTNNKNENRNKQKKSK